MVDSPTIHHPWLAACFWASEMAVVCSSRALLSDAVRWMLPLYCVGEAPCAEHVLSAGGCVGGVIIIKWEPCPGLRISLFFFFFSSSLTTITSPSEYLT